MALTLIFLLVSLFLVIKSADYAIRYSTKLAKNFHLSKYIIGFIIVAIISILPETLISLSSAINGIPSFGLGTLYGSNVADLTLVFALVIFISGRNLKVESRVIKNSLLYIAIMAVPIILGFNGHYSRLEGIALIVLGFCFYFYVLKNSPPNFKAAKEPFSIKNLAMLITSMAILLLGAHFTVKYGVALANDLRINPVIIAMFIVGLGTTLPELLFSIRATKKRQDGLALGDILGTVIADATIVVGIVATISPFIFNPRLVYVTGAFMVLAIILLFYFMKSGRKLSQKEAFLLLLFYMAFILAELFISGL